jgi:hypothetical protein
MNGEIESLNRIKEKGDAFDHTIGLPCLLREAQECEHLAINGSDLIKLSPEECGQIAVDLASYAIYIQRTLSKETSYLKWLESKISLAIAPELNSYVGYFSNEQRRSMAIVSNEYAYQLEELRVVAQLKVDMLAQVPFQINQLVKTVLEIQASKRFRHA